MLVYCHIPGWRIGCRPGSTLISRRAGEAPILYLCHLTPYVLQPSTATLGATAGLATSSSTYRQNPRIRNERLDGRMRKRLGGMSLRRCFAHSSRRRPSPPTNCPKKATRHLSGVRCSPPVRQPLVRWRAARQRIAAEVRKRLC